MDIDSIKSFVREASELTRSEKSEILFFIGNNEDDIEIDTELQEFRSYSQDYLEVIVSGPNGFQLEFNVDCNSYDVSLSYLEIPV